VGLPLGVLLVTGEKDGIHPMPGWAMKTLNIVINLLRSVPFLILMIIVLPLSKIIVGTKVGTIATIPPMVIAAFPLVARMVESSLEEVDHGIIEAAQSMGSTNSQIIFKVLLPEAVPSLVNGAAISITTILGYTALASAAGGGGLGALAIVKGMNVRNFDMMYSASILLVIIVQIITVFGTRLTRSLDHKRR
jgi:D-methionine transport system permease protein